MKYAIALGGADEYKTSGIPHCWLVGPNGKIVFEGHPSGISEAVIEENLRGVRLKPSFDDLPEAFGKARMAFEKDDWAKGLKELEKLEKDEANAQAATAAKEKVLGFGKESLASAVAKGEGGDYTSAMKALDKLADDWKGCEIGDEAKKQRDGWKKDKTVKLELDAEELLLKAAELEKAGQKPAAAAVLKKVCEGKKYEGTKARARAEERLKALGG